MAADRTIDVAKAFQLQGRTAEAENLYREVLARQPDALEALEGLGVLVFQRGNAQEASVLFARGVLIDPSSARFHANLGESLRTMGRHDEALDHLRKAAVLDPADVQAWNSLGLVALDMRRHQAAEHAFREAIRLHPRFVHGHINLANTFAASGRAHAAVELLRSALRIEPQSAIALVNLARLLCDLRDPELLAEAEEVARRAVAVAPQIPLAQQTLARVLRLQGRLDLVTNLDQRPFNRDVPERLGHALIGPRKLSTGGLALMAEGQLDQAENCLREALRLDSTLVDAWVGLATIQAQRGEFERSCESAHAALAVRPDTSEAYWQLATNLHGRLPDTEVAAIERLLGDPSLANDDRALLHFALATVQNQRSLYSQAAAHYDAANLQQSAGKLSRGLVYNPDRHSWFIDQIIARFTAEFLATGEDGACPIRGRCLSSAFLARAQPWSNKCSPPIPACMARASCWSCTTSSNHSRQSSAVLPPIRSMC